MYRIRGAILIGILITAVISWPRGTAVTYFPRTEAGDAMFDYFKKVVTFRKLEKVGLAIDVCSLAHSCVNSAECTSVQLCKRKGVVCAYHLPLC